MPVGLVTPAASIFSPGAGPNGPGPIDMRRRISSVGEGSSCPYGPTNGYANPGGVMGHIGPAAGSLQRSITWYVRSTGSNLNGGTSSSTTADRTGSDGASTSGSLTFTSASAAFTTADVGKGICIQNATRCYAKIVSINSATSVQLSNPPSATASSLSWSIGGAWATLEPLLNSNANANTTCGVTSGDTVYVGAGTYRVVHTIGTNFGATWKPTGAAVLNALAYFNGVVSVVADVAGEFTGDAGPVTATAYTGSDKAAPSATTLLNMNGRSNFSFLSLILIGGTAANPVLTAAATSQNLSFIDCALVGLASQNGIVAATAAVNGILQLNWLFDRCYIVTRSSFLTVTAPQGTMVGVQDIDLNVTVRNSLIIAGLSSSVSVILLTGTGGSTGKTGGVRLRSCTILGGAGTALAVNSSANSTIFPSSVYGSLIVTSTALSAQTLGQIVEDYNILSAGTARTLVNIGSHSISDNSYSLLFHFGQERIWGGIQRPFGVPLAGSPLLGFGELDGDTVYDLMNNPRPAGGDSPLPAVGALERGDTFVQAQVPAPPSGTNIWQITGPGYQDLLLPVSAVADGFSIVVQRDAAYSGQTAPAVIMLPNQIIGVAGQTVVDSGGSGSWNTLTLQSFTPTGTGWVTIRLISYDGTGSSVVSFANATPS